MGINNDYSVLKELNNYKNYDVVIRKMINNEIDRQYSIVKWNLVIQSFLFGALSQMKNNDYLIAIIVYGLLASFISFASYLASETKIRRILYFWDGYRRFKGLSFYVFPPVWSSPYEDPNNDKEIRLIFGDFRINWFQKICLNFILPKISHFVFIIVWVIIILIKHIL